MTSSWVRKKDRMSNSDRSIGTKLRSNALEERMNGSENSQKDNVNDNTLLAPVIKLFLYTVIPAVGRLAATVAPIPGGLGGLRL